jgi:ribosomal protein S18 acetylase RimI-like enzyme
MTLDDVPAVYRLGAACYDCTAIPYVFWTLTEVGHHFESFPDLCVVADADGEVVGFGLAAPSYEVLEGTGHLEWVAVAPEQRREGLARRLVDTLLEALKARGCQTVIADVTGANEPSRRLFERAGFDEGTTITFFRRRL